MNTASQQRPFVVTGASGWFGRTALWEYEQLYGAEALRRDVVACASTAKEIDIGSHHGPIMAVPLEEIDFIDEASGLIHLAFLTRDRLSKMGVDQYIHENRRITARIADFINRNPLIPIVTTSSGAAGVFDNKKPDLVGNPYGVLKQEEEDLWRSSCQDRLAIVFRVYASAGRFIKDPRLFALGDFLSRALARQRIEIRSEHPVIRSYVHVGTMMRLFWAMLEQPDLLGFRLIDAAMQTLSLLELAQAISNLWSLPEPCFRIHPSLAPDDYRADEAPFRELLVKYGITEPNLTEQLKETALYMSEPQI